MTTVKNKFLELLDAKAKKEGRQISQRTAAKETGLWLQTINQYARNEVTRYDAETLQILCDYLDCGIGDLLVNELAWVG